MLSYQKLISFWLIALPNLALFYVGLWLTILWRYPEGLDSERLSQHVLHFSIIYVLWLLTFISFRLFERETFRRYTSLIFSLVSAMAANLVIAIGYFYSQPELVLTPRRFLILHVGLVFLLVLLWNLLLKATLIGKLIQPVYLFSLDKELRNLEQEISKHDYFGYKVLGHISEADLNNLPAESGAVVIFPDNLHANPGLAEMIFNLRKRGIRFYDHNSFYERLLRRVYLPSLSQIWFVQNITYTRKIFFGLVKSVFDFAVGLVISAIFLATFPLVALIVKLNSGGPTLFKQARVGKDGKVFIIYKYRTMKISTDENRWTEPNDQRVTAVGKFLRKTRIDELPQSVNLLLGNMSLVGPRPEQVGIVERLKQEIPFYDERHIVKPGVTGWAQLNIYAGNLEETKLKLEYDLYYIKNQSILFDLEIILKTIYNIFTGSGR